MWNDNVKQTNNNRRWIIMKKSIKKLIKSNNIELKADIKEIKKQYKKDIKALDNKYSKQIENKKTIDGQDSAITEQEDATEIKCNVDVSKNDLDIQNDTKNLKVT